MLNRLLALTFLGVSFCTQSLAQQASGVSIQISVADGILNGSIDGHVQLLVAPAGTDPLDDTDVTSSPDYFFGQNVYGLNDGASVILSAGGGDDTDHGVFGWPNVSLTEVEPGDYTIQAYLNIYEKVIRADGSKVSLRFPCGDGAPGIAGYGNPLTSLLNATITGDTQVIELKFDNFTAPEDFTGSEIGSCQQGNYEDTELLKYVKIRSEVLSNWWNRDVFVGANVLLPSGYDSADSKTRYPVIYSQGHWPGGSGGFSYPDDEDFASAWDNGTVPATNETDARPAPKLIVVTFRHETPWYDDSYAVNTANLGPWGDAINEELIPYLDATFNTIPEPYARIQQGGSTGGWESAANLIFRPDLFGACFSSYPDSLDFHRHQDIPLYTNANAYVRENGSSIPSIRTHINGTEVVLASVAQENHWELTYGTSSRSFQQWDIWNAVFGAQGYNGYPLEPWDKVTGEIFHEAVEYWKPMDLAYHVTSNWDNELNLGAVLQNRIFVYVGTWDNYYLNEGVAQFQMRTEEKGGSGWANFTYLEGRPHGGIYNNMDVWDYLDLLQTWISDHAPDGKTPLAKEVTTPEARGNVFEDVMKRGGRGAAVARQSPPILDGKSATVGRWDPGVKLEAEWIVNAEPCGEPFVVEQGEQITYEGGSMGSLQIKVTGRKRGYATETRVSNVVDLG